jgi:DnaJ-class molecular chaperone
VAKKSKSAFGGKPGYFEKLKMGTSHDTYNPEKEGYGSEAEWCSTFNVRMGFEEASEVRRNSKRGQTDYQILAEFAGVHVDSSSMWSEIRSAFRKASMAQHPDRVTQTGLDPKVAEENFKEISAAFTMLEDVYRKEGRLD